MDPNDPRKLVLPEPFHETDRAKLLRWLPWLHLTRAFRLATRWQNLAIVTLAVVVLTAGRWGISQLPLAAGAPPGTGVAWPWEPNFTNSAATASHREPFEKILESPLSVLRYELSETGRFLGPLRDMVVPARLIFRKESSWATIGWAWSQLLLNLIVWSFFAGAVTRRVALEFSGQGELGLWKSLRFAGREFSSTAGAPLAAAVSVAVLFLLGRGLGWIGAMPVVGETIGALLWGMQFFFGLIMSLILLGLAVCWPLMIASHVTEGTDGFDALSRAYNYVFVRPWYAFWMVSVSLLYGAAVSLFLTGLVALSLHLTFWLQAPNGTDALERFTADAPASLNHFVPERRFDTPDQTLGRSIGCLWLWGLATVLTAFVYSYFWASVTIIYMLLRKSVDAYAFDRIYLPQIARATNAIPLVGVPAAALRELSAQSVSASGTTTKNATATEASGESTAAGAANAQGIGDPAD